MQKTRINKIYLTLMVTIFMILVFLLSACSMNPSEADARKVVEKQYKDLVRVVSLKETNAQKAELAGIKFYEMEYDAEIEYLDDVVIEKFMGEINGIRKGKRGPFDFLGREIKKGTREKIKGALTFEQTKKGWRVR